MKQATKVLLGIAVGFLALGALLLVIVAFRFTYFYPDEGEGVDIGAGLLFLAGQVFMAVGLVVAVSAAITAVFGKARSNPKDAG